MTTQPSSRGAVTVYGVTGPAGTPGPIQTGLEGSWRVEVTIATGPFVGVQQFLVMYSAGGGMVESSNFDEMPPVPPAYGSWEATGESTFRSTYVFFTTESVDGQNPGAGWAHSGSGKFQESITVGPNRLDYTSRLSYQLYDVADQPLPQQSGDGFGIGRRIVVEF
jgi:hypothetical protein